MTGRVSKQSLPIEAFVVEPPLGANFALPSAEAPERFRKHVLATLNDAEWRKYYDIPPSLAERIVFGGSAPVDGSLAFFRGAEGALLALALQLQPEMIWAPQDSYPGYERVARAVRATFRHYSDGSIPPPQSSAGETWLIVTHPGNPRDNFVDTREWARWSSGWPRLIVDATYEMPGTKKFRQLVSVALKAGAGVVFSFSKALPLAGLRLGGCVLPNGVSQPPAPHHHWAVLDAAVMSAMSDPGVAECLEVHREAQLRVHRLLIDALERRGHQVIGRETGIFVTTFFHEELVMLTGKRYPSGIVRLDSSLENVHLLMNCTGVARD